MEPMDNEGRPRELKELFNLHHNGIFQLIGSASGLLPMDGNAMDRFLISDYGMRRCASLVYFWWSEDDFDTEDDGALITNTRAHIADDVKRILGPKWGRQMAMYNAEYDPLYNYYDQYTESLNDVNSTIDNTSRTRHVDDDLAHGMTTTITDNLSESGSTSSSTSGSGSNSNERFGFNSSQAVGESEQSSSDSSQSTGSHTVTNTGTKTFADSGTDQRDISETDTKSQSVRDELERQKASTHRGNIGNITTQQLVREEIELWRWNLAREMCRDVAELLTYPLYF